MSGSGLNPFLLAKDPETFTPSFAKSLKCPFVDSIDMIDCLRSKSYQEVLDASFSGIERNSNYLMNLGLIIDGLSIPSDPRKIFSTSPSQFSLNSKSSNGDDAASSSGKSSSSLNGLFGSSSSVEIRMINSTPSSQSSMGSIKGSSSPSSTPGTSSSPNRSKAGSASHADHNNQANKKDDVMLSENQGISSPFENQKTGGSNRQHNDSNINSNHHKINSSQSKKGFLWNIRWINWLSLSSLNGTLSIGAALLFVNSLVFLLIFRYFHKEQKDTGAKTKAVGKKLEDWEEKCNSDEDDHRTNFFVTSESSHVTTLSAGNEQQENNFGSSSGASSSGMTLMKTPAEVYGVTEMSTYSPSRSLMPSTTADVSSASFMRKKATTSILKNRLPVGTSSSSSSPVASSTSSSSAVNTISGFVKSGVTSTGVLHSNECYGHYLLRPSAGFSTKRTGGGGKESLDEIECGCHHINQVDPKERGMHENMTNRMIQDESDEKGNDAVGQKDCFIGPSMYTLNTTTSESNVERPLAATHGSNSTNFSSGRGSGVTSTGTVKRMVRIKEDPTLVKSSKSSFRKETKTTDSSDTQQPHIRFELPDSCCNSSSGCPPPHHQQHISSAYDATTFHPNEKNSQYGSPDSTGTINGCIELHTSSAAHHNSTSHVPSVQYSSPLFQQSLPNYSGSSMSRGGVQNSSSCAADSASSAVVSSSSHFESTGGNFFHSPPSHHQMNDTMMMRIIQTPADDGVDGHETMMSAEKNRRRAATNSSNIFWTISSDAPLSSSSAGTSVATTGSTGSASHPSTSQDTTLATSVSSSLSSDLSMIQLSTLPPPIPPNPHYQLSSFDLMSEETGVATYPPPLNHRTIRFQEDHYGHPKNFTQYENLKYDRNKGGVEMKGGESSFRRRVSEGNDGCSYIQVLSHHNEMREGHDTHDSNRSQNQLVTNSSAPDVNDTENYPHHEHYCNTSDGCFVQSNDDVTSVTTGSYMGCCNYCSTGGLTDSPGVLNSSNDRHYHHEGDDGRVGNHHQASHETSMSQLQQHPPPHLQESTNGSQYMHSHLNASDPHDDPNQIHTLDLTRRASYDGINLQDNNCDNQFININNQSYIHHQHPY